MPSAVSPPVDLIGWCDAASPILKLPQGQRFCSQLERDCARPWAMLHRRLLNASNGLPIVANGIPTTCGFGTDIMERAGLVAIAAGMRRPIVFYNSVSEPMRMVTEPHHDILAAGMTREAASAARPFVTEASCQASLARAIAISAAPPLIPHKCVEISIPGFEPGFVIHPIWEPSNKFWDFGERQGRPGVHRAETLFAPAPLHFISHNAIGAFGPLIAAPSIPPALRSGATLSSSPRCITARLLGRVSREALARATSLLARLNARGKIYAVHVRRGDSAMHRECPRCVAPTEPDIKEADRVSLGDVERKLRELNRSLAEGDGVFLASDTRGGLHAARRQLSSVPISWQRHGRLETKRSEGAAGGGGRIGGGRAEVADAGAAEEGREERWIVAAAAIHSTQFTGVTAATKLLADFIAMAIADEVIRLGESSLSGCAERLSGLSEVSG